jgi:hypothetical protein
VLLPRVSMLFGRVRPGVFAGLLSVFVFRLMPQWDAPLTACALVLFLLCANPATWRSGAFSGAAAGLLLLFNPATILITGPRKLPPHPRRHVRRARFPGCPAMDAAKRVDSGDNFRQKQFRNDRICLKQ